VRDNRYTQDNHFLGEGLPPEAIKASTGFNPAKIIKNIFKVKPTSKLPTTESRPREISVDEVLK
jgi:hypothetical protein